MYLDKKLLSQERRKIKSYEEIIERFNLSLFMNVFLNIKKLNPVIVPLGYRTNHDILPHTSLSLPEVTPQNTVGYKATSGIRPPIGRSCFVVITGFYCNGSSFMQIRVLFLYATKSRKFYLQVPFGHRIVYTVESLYKRHVGTEENVSYTYMSLL